MYKPPFTQRTLNKLTYFFSFKMFFRLEVYLLLYSTFRFSTFGIYIIMMTNIIKTLVKVGTFDCFVFWTMPPESIIFFRSLKFTSPFLPRSLSCSFPL